MNLLNKMTIRTKDFIVNHYFTFLVAFVVLFALILRYFHTKIGLPYLYNWDEPQTASTALQIMKTGDFNPHFFNYGSMMIYSNFVVDILHYLSLMGHPSTAETYLNNMNEIRINADTGWHWTISHPSFYHWNRMLTALLGTGTVLVTYLIGKQVFNKWTGLVAAIFLAILPFHISQSAWIATDAPVAFFVLTVVLFSILFIQYKKPSHFILSLLFVGISIATKYNAALTILIPLIALIIVYFQSRESVKTYMWFLIPLIPVIVFLMIMPYAIIDLTTFLKDVGFEVRHYKVKGHPGATSIAGWEHFSFQIQQFYRQLDLMNTIVIAIGIIGIFLRPLLIFVLMLPVMYILYMTGMTVNFHRNFVQVYPFLAIMFASGIYTIYYLIGFIQNRFLSNKIWITAILTLLITLSILLPQSYASMNMAKIKYKSKDTRTKVIDELNTLKDVKNIIIAQELRIHSQDLKRLKIQYTVMPLLEITSRARDKNTLYLLPKNITSFHMARDKKKLEPLQKFIATIDESSVVQTVDGGGTRIDIYSVNPGMILVKDLPIIPMEILVDKAFKIDFEKCNMSKPYKGNPLGMPWSGSITTPLYAMKENSYKLVINAKGTKAFDEYAKLKIQVFKTVNKNNILITEKVVETKPNFTEFTIPFELQEDNNVSFVVSFINDKSRKEPKEDRNVYLKSIILKKQ